MNPNKLYLRVLSEYNGSVTSSNFIMEDFDSDELTDEALEAGKNDIVKTLLSTSPEGTRILSAEFVAHNDLDVLVRDNDQTLPWRTLDYIVCGLSYKTEAPSEASPIHPQFVPLGAIRVLVDESPSMMHLSRRESIRAMAANYVMETFHTPVYTIDQIEPDAYWAYAAELARRSASGQGTKAFLKIVTVKELQRVSDLRIERATQQKYGDKTGKGSDN